MKIYDVYVKLLKGLKQAESAGAYTQTPNKKTLHSKKVTELHLSDEAEIRTGALWSYITLHLHQSAQTCQGEFFLQKLFL